MENEILSQILSELKELKAGQQVINQRLDKMDERLDKVEARLDTIESDISIIKSDVNAMREQLLDLEAKNAKNHVEMKSAIKDLEDKLSVLEVVSGQNMRDIGLLKAVRS